MGMEAIYSKPRTSIPNKTHRIYPCLLRKLEIESADQVWCAHICFAPPYGWLPRPSAPMCRCRRVTLNCAR